MTSRNPSGRAPREDGDDHVPGQVGQDRMTATTTAPNPIATLLAQFDAGKKAALARAVSIVENRRAGADELLAALHPRLGRARRIGITGPPGAGKSTLTTE